MLTLLFITLTSTRPLLTDDPWPVDAGMFELEAGQGFTKSKEGYIQWKYGWGRFELDMGFPWTLSDTRELGELKLAAKWGFLSEKSLLPDLALVSCMTPGTGFCHLWAIAGKSFGPTELLANLVYEMGNPRLSWGAAGVYYPAERLGLCLEVFDEGEPVFGGGLRVFPFGALMLDLGYHWASEGSGDFGAGFTFDF